MRLFIVYILFAASEYTLRTFVKSYEYHERGFYLQFLPFIITALTGSLICYKLIRTGHFGWTYLKLTAVSIGGFLTAKTILYIQWYLHVAPGYRGKLGDIIEGMAWDLPLSIIGSTVIALTYLVSVAIIKLIRKMGGD